MSNPEKESLHLVKLCVGAEKVSDLAQWQSLRLAEQKNRGENPTLRHVTRMWPKREDELLSGGSLYWVFKGQILARQKIERFDEVIGGDGIRRCGIVLSPTLVLTHAQPRRPFQGWRYLAGDIAPQDMGLYREGSDELPVSLRTELAALGVL